MKYPRFEVLALAVGAISILVGVATAWSSAPLIEEVVAQGLLLIVLVGAVHKGRRGGTVMAIVASVAYVGMRIPLIAHSGLTLDVVLLLVGRILSYTVLGVGGGILCARIHYILAQFESSPNLEPITQLFNQRYIGVTLRSLVGQHERYGTPFSVVSVLIPDLLAARPAPDRLHPLRAVAEHLRDGVRLIDQVARLDDGSFVLVLPHTGKPGAQIAAARIHAVVMRVLQGRNEVRVEVLGAEDDLAAIKDLCDYPAATDDHLRVAAKSA